MWQRICLLFTCLNVRRLEEFFLRLPYLSKNFDKTSKSFSEGCHSEIWNVMDKSNFAQKGYSTIYQRKWRKTWNFFQQCRIFILLKTAHLFCYKLGFIWFCFLEKNRKKQKSREKKRKISFSRENSLFPEKILFSWIFSLFFFVCF